MITEDDVLKSIFRKILEEPEEDLHRLVYADRLDELAKTSPCENCDGKGHAGTFNQTRMGFFETECQMVCSVCFGSGYTPDTIAARAEFIRVQCELSASRDTVISQLFGPIKGTNPIVVKDADSKRREYELSTANRDRWFPVPDGYGLDWDIRVEALASDTRPAYIVRRGFVDEVWLTLNDFVGSSCVVCDGSGYTGRHWDPASDTLRGGITCKSCKGSGIVEGLARVLFENNPITKVVLTDRSPEEVDEKRNCRWYISEYDEGIGTSWVVPAFLYENIPQSKARWVREFFMQYESLELANNALSDGCVRFGRLMARI